MYAVIETGGKQYKVSSGDEIYVEKMDAQAGEVIDLKVLMVESDGKILTGNPVDGAKVTAEVVGNVKGQKIIVYKYKAKKNVRKKNGHRQQYTKLKINAIG